MILERGLERPFPVLLPIQQGTSEKGRAPRKGIETAFGSSATSSSLPIPYVGKGERLERGLEHPLPPLGVLGGSSLGVVGRL